MPNKLQCEQPKENEIQRTERATFEKLIREQVMHALGTPSDLRKVQIRKLWNDHYRVNVVVGVNLDSLRIANSYFLEIGGDGSLISATPKITKQY